jgi:hypothetical protein
MPPRLSVIAEQLVRDAAAFDRPGWIAFLFGVIRAHIRPERIGVADELGFGIWLERL